MRLRRSHLSALIIPALAVVVLLVNLTHSGSAETRRQQAGTRTTQLRSAIPTIPAVVRPASRSVPKGTVDSRLRRIGFRSEDRLRQHFEKHGREFGDVTIDAYLAMAQDLRDAPLSASILESEQIGGSLSRFDRSTGAFIAFDRDLTIRTFFRPTDGEAYFLRAAQKQH